MDVYPGISDSCPNVLQGASSQLLLTLINTLLASQCALGPEGRYPLDYGPKLKDGDEFDFIVVGAGSAGSVVANRLSDVTQWKVLLLEAGGYPSATSEIPALTLSMHDTDEDWSYRMQPSNHYCLGQKNNQCKSPRGKGLGGTSLLNGMTYTRSIKNDHDRWTSQGIKGWDYESVLENYRNIENAHTEHNTEYGNMGELHLTRHTSTDSIRKIMQDAYEELGFNQWTEEAPIGYTDVLTSIYEGTRQNTAKAFLAPIKNRNNLYVATNAQVGRLLIHKDLVVQGVEVKIQGRILSLRSKKEVILSAGSINSPQILMNSGIGPKNLLSELGIPVIKDLKVGDNLQDHLMFPGFVIGLDHLKVAPSSEKFLTDELFSYFMHRQGIFSTMGLVHFFNFINTRNDTNRPNALLSQVLIKKNDAFALQMFAHGLGIPQETATSLAQYNNNHPLLVITVASLHPKFRGHLRLQNSDPFSKPLLTSNFFSDEDSEDMEDLLDAVKFIQKLIKTNVFATHNPKLIDLEITKCKDFVKQSDDFWKCAFRNMVSSAFHQVGTCKMGTDDDPTAVVDSRLRVRGVKGVRVVDGSIIPLITSGCTNAPIIMVGDRGAAFIKEDWLRTRSEL